MSWASPEEKLMLVLEAALREFDGANACSPDRHQNDCGCSLCSWVEGTRKTLEHWREREESKR